MIQTQGEHAAGDTRGGALEAGNNPVGRRSTRRTHGRGQGFLVAETSPCIAIVDDDPAVLRALSRLLRSRTFRVMTYGSGQEFLAALPDGLPQCLIVDFQMPEMNGMELHQHTYKQRLYLFRPSSSQHMQMLLYTQHRQEIRLWPDCGSRCMMKRCSRRSTERRPSAIRVRSGTLAVIEPGPPLGPKDWVHPTV